MIRRHPLVAFFVLAFLLAWLIALPLILSPAGLGVIHADVPVELIILVATTPTIAALIVQRATEGNYRICRFAASPRPLIAGLVGGAVLALLTFVVIPDLI